MVVQSLFAEDDGFMIYLGYGRPLMEKDILHILKTLDKSSCDIMAIKNEIEYSDVKSMQKAFKRVIENQHLKYDISTSRGILLIRKPYSLV